MTRTIEPRRMICSLNQIEQTVRKAVRGAGLPWGLADDAGKAVRWLHTYGINGVAALAGLLERHDYRNSAQLSPVSLSGVWRASGGVLDPLLTGASLSDCFDRPGAARIETAAIARPLLAAGFIGNLAQIEERVFTLTWRDVRLNFRRGGLWLEGSAVEAETADFLRCQQCGDPGQNGRNFQGRHHAPRAGQATVESADWQRLEQYAHRTYVEASDASRMIGAGAGLHDND